MSHYLQRGIIEFREACPLSTVSRAKPCLVDEKVSFIFIVSLLGPG